MDDPADLEDVVVSALQEPRYAIDTEFHRERTYFPQVAMIQLAWGDQVALIDPLILDPAPLGRLLDSDALCIMHAGSQDLEVLDLVCGTIPTRLFDTQIAAGFLGVSSGSLQSLLDRYLGVDLLKGDRLTDWLQRPLTKDQCTYAAADVDHLIELADVVSAQLQDRGRVAWAESEAEALRVRPRNHRPPEEAIKRIKEARSLRGNAAKIALAVAAWRERRAAEMDIPVRQVLSDLAVVGVAQRVPKSEADLLAIRGLDRRHLRNDATAELLSAVQLGLRADAPAKKERQSELPKELKPVVSLVTSWISQLARDHALDPALLATRKDVEALLTGGVSSRLDTGWRADLVGEPISALVQGKASLAFDGGGMLVLEQRSGEAF